MRHPMGEWMGFIPSLDSNRITLLKPWEGLIMPNQLLNCSSGPELPSRDNPNLLPGIYFEYPGKKSTMIIKFQKTTLKFDTGLLSWKVGKNTNDHVQWGEIVSKKGILYHRPHYIIIFHGKIRENVDNKGQSTPFKRIYLMD
jgi:hypothetical protein